MKPVAVFTRSEDEFDKLAGGEQTFILTDDEVKALGEESAFVVCKEGTEDRLWLRIFKSFGNKCYVEAVLPGIAPTPSHGVKAMQDMFNNNEQAPDPDFLQCGFPSHVDIHGLRFKGTVDSLGRVIFFSEAKVPSTVKEVKAYENCPFVTVEKADVEVLYNYLESEVTASGKDDVAALGMEAALSFERLYDRKVGENYPRSIKRAEEYNKEKTEEFK